MLIKIVVCAVFLVLINITDIKGYKIKNKFVLPTIIVGLTVALISNTFTDSIFGMLIPLVLFPLYALKMLGAGDIKALCAIGAVLGVKLSIETLLFTFVSGGVIALVFMLVNKNFIERFKNLFNYFKVCYLARKVLNYDYGGKTNSYFRFSYAITAGTMLALANNYLCVI